MSWGAVLLFGSGLLFSTGLSWFFVQAWIFAIEARTTWLLVLLTITSTVALLSQTYLCAVVISITPDDHLFCLRRDQSRFVAVGLVFKRIDWISLGRESKPIGVTPVNREAFASFPFDETASLVRRRDRDDRPTFGWEVNSAPNIHISGDNLAATCKGTRASPSRLSPFMDRSEGSVGVCAGGVGDDDEEGGGDGGMKGEGEEKMPSTSRQLRNHCADTDRGGDRLRLFSSGNLGVSVAEAAAAVAAMAWGRVHSATLGVAPPEETVGDCVGGVSRGEERECGMEGTQQVGEDCVEDALESGCAEPFPLGGGSMMPVELLKSDREPKETRLGCEEGVVDDGSTGVKLSMQQQQQRHHEDQGHERTKRYVWRDDASDASDLDSTVAQVGGKLRLGKEDDALGTQGRCDVLVSNLSGNVEGDVNCRANIDVVDIELTKAAAARMPEGRENLAEACCPRRRDKASVRVNELPDLCAICLGQYAAGEQVYVLPCLHIFHAQCLDVWITEHPSCPYCKGNLNVVVPKRTAMASCTRRVTSFVAWSLTIFHDRPSRRREHTGDHIMPSPPTAMPSPAVVP